MNPASPIPAVLAILMALVVCLALTRRYGPPAEQGGVLAIDGLRGYLAFCVFLHHSLIWYFYLKTGQWAVPPSNLYTHFGQTSVAFFFMITGFLFVSKILNGKRKEIDWLRLYVSRLLRLLPLYYIVIAILLAVVFALPSKVPHESVGVLALEIVRWLSFTMLDGPDINGVALTSIVLAGVTWSLPYEWYFYLLLPAFALLNRVRVGWVYILISLATVAFICTKNTTLYNWLSFLGGVLAAYIVQYEQLCDILRNRISSIIAVLLVTSVVLLYPTAYGWGQIAMLSAAFNIIAAGNGVFGLFTNRVSRTLGEMAYSIYLLHGLMLFITFRFIIGFESTKDFTPETHWITILAITPVLICVSYFSYRKIEHPALSKTTALTTWLRRKASGSPAVA